MKEFNIEKSVAQAKLWKDDLSRYWPAIDKNQELYEFSATRDEETVSDISLNTPFSIIESMVAKANDSNMHVTVSGKGENDLDEFGRYISTILKDVMEDYDIQAVKGSFRKIKEKFFREFLVKGNAVATVEWYYKEGVADNPYIRVRPLKTVIFNPTKTLADSDKYYIESNVKYQDLLDNEEKDGKGLYKNLGELKKLSNEKNKDIEEYDLSGGSKIYRKAEPIRLLECWDNDMYYVIADDKVLIREKKDPMKLGGNNLITAMNYVIEGRPYAYGEIDAIYKPTIAQDTIINQSIDMTNRYLRPAILVDANANVNLDELIMIIEEGGVMQGNPQMIGHIPMQTPPRESFQTIDILQQAIERAARYSPYAVGLPSQQTDKTEGTKGGIQSIQVAAEPNFQVKQDALQESFCEPAARMELKMVANLMGENDTRYGLMKGKDKGWVKASKNILLGKANLKELFTCGFINEEEYQKATTEPDPMTGQPVPIPGMEETMVFDVDWVIKVKLDSKSAADKDREIQQKISVVQLGRDLGAQWHPERTITKIAEAQGFDDVGELFLTEEEKKQMPPPPEAQAEQAKVETAKALADSKIKTAEALAQAKIQSQQQQTQVKTGAETQKMSLEAQKNQMGMQVQSDQALLSHKTQSLQAQQTMRHNEMRLMQEMKHKEMQGNQDLEMKKKQSVLLDKQAKKEDKSNAKDETKRKKGKV